MNGFDSSADLSARRSPRRSRTPTCRATRSTTVLDARAQLHARRITRFPPCRRELPAASIPDRGAIRRASSKDRTPCPGAATRRPARRPASPTADGSIVAGPFPCFDYPTLATSLDARGLPWRYYTPAVRAATPAVCLWSAYDSITRRPLRPRLERNVVSPETTSSRRHQRDARRRDLGRPVVRRTPITGQSVAQRTRLGRERSSTRSARARSGTRPRSSFCGTTGAAGTTTSRRRNSTSRPRLPRAAARDLAVREARPRLARAIRIRQHRASSPSGPSGCHRSVRPTCAPTTCSTASISRRPAALRAARVAP